MRLGKCRTNGRAFYLPRYELLRSLAYYPSCASAEEGSALTLHFLQNLEAKNKNSEVGWLSCDFPRHTSMHVTMETACHRKTPKKFCDVIFMPSLHIQKGLWRLVLLYGSQHFLAFWDPSVQSPCPAWKKGKARIFLRWQNKFEKLAFNPGWRILIGLD